MGETINSIAAPTAAYSLRSLTGGDPLAVRVRRSSNDASAEKDFTVSEINSGALLNHINEDVITEQSDFTSGVDGYSKDSHGSVAREATYEGKSDVLNYTHSGGRFAFRKNTIALERTSSYTIAFEYYADTVFNNLVWGVENAFANRTTASSNSPTVVSDAWTSVTLNVPNGRTTGVQYLALRIEDHSAGSSGDDYGTTINGSVRIKNIVVTSTTGSGYVSIWYDQSGNGNNAPQTTEDDQPKIVSNGSLVSNGIDFDGTSHSLDMPTNLISSINSASGFVVAKSGTTSGSRAALALSKNSPDFRFYIPVLVSSNFNFGYQDSATKISLGSADTNKHLSTAIAGSSNAEAFLDGTSKGTVSSADGKTALTSGGIGSINDGTFWEGQIEEIIIYNSDQTANRTKLETNIMNHYSIS